MAYYHCLTWRSTPRCRRGRRRTCRWTACRPPCRGCRRRSSTAGRAPSSRMSCWAANEYNTGVILGFVHLKVQPYSFQKSTEKRTFSFQVYDDRGGLLQVPTPKQRQPLFPQISLNFHSLNNVPIGLKPYISNKTYYNFARIFQICFEVARFSCIFEQKYQKRTLCVL